MAVFWVVTPCSLVEDRHLRTHRRENLKSKFYLICGNQQQINSWFQKQKVQHR
jgi:hypothetical protein